MQVAATKVVQRPCAPAPDGRYLRICHSFFLLRRHADRTVTLSQIVHLRAPPHE